MRRPLVLLSLLLCALLVAVLWTWLSGRDGGDARAAELSPRSGPAHAAPLAPERLPTAPREPSAPAQGEERAQAATVAPEPASARDPLAAAELPDGSLWIEGRVVLPDGTPADEVLHVRAKGATFPGSKSREQRARVAPDGRFRVAFAKGTRIGFVELEGTWVYLDERAKVRPGQLEDELVLAPALGGRIEGRVSPPPGVVGDAWLQDLKVGATTFSGRRVLRNADVGAGGYYRVDALPPGSDYRLVANSPVFAPGRSTDVEVEPGRSVTVDLDLERGVRIAGRVVDRLGEGVPEARLQVRVMREGGDFDLSDVKLLQAEADGSFLLQGLAAGTVSITFTKRGFLDEEQSYENLEDGAVREGVEVRLASGDSILGRVVWPDGSPAGGATVTCEQDGDRGFVLFGGGNAVEASADGSFEIAGLEEGACKLDARARPDGEQDDGRRRRWWRARAEEVRPGTRGLVLTLEEGEPVRGRCVDDRGEPVTAFRVVATPVDEDGDVSYGDRIGQLFRDSDGRFEMKGLLDGEYELVAQSLTNVDSEPVRCSVPTVGGSIDLVLPRSAEVRGIVRDPSGQALAGATVSSNGSGSDDTTDSEGRFRLDDLSPGTALLEANAERFAPSEPREIALEPGAQVEGVVLTVRPGARITGELHASIEERANRQVTFSRSGGGGWRNERTDGDGRFEAAGFAPGTYTVTLQGARAAGDPSGSAGWILRNARQHSVEVELSLGASEHIVLGAPPEDPIRVFGVVTQGGKAVAGTLLAFDPSASGANSRAARTNAAGEYELLLEVGGGYTVQVGTEWSDRLSYRLEVPAVDGHRLDFALPSASVSGRVLDPQGAPAAGVQVTLEREAPESEHAADIPTGDRRATTDGDGEWEIDRLPGGTYTAQAGTRGGWNPRRTERDLGRCVRAGLELEEGGRLDGVVLELSLPGRISGTVVHPDGRPAEGATVTVQTGAGVSLEGARDRTDASGRYSISGLPPGTLRVRAWTSDEQGSNQGGPLEVRLIEGGSAELTLALAR